MLRNAINYIRHLPRSLKFSMAGILAALLIATPFVVSAGFAPDRPVLDWNNPNDRFGFDHPVFNSFIHTPDYGDERTFFDGRDASIPASTVGGFQDSMNVTPGQELTLRTFIHNDANQDLNASGAGIAHNTQVRIFVPTATDKALRSISYLSASNVTPHEVNDTVDFVGATPFGLQYEPGSARAATNAVPGGYQVADSIVTSGAPIGYTGPNGEIPGCFQFATIVTIKVKVTGPALNLVKQVRKVGDTTWSKNLTANPGDTVEYQLNATNKGTSQLNNLVVGDNLPAGEVYQPGSTNLRNAANPNGLHITSDDIVHGGINVGNYGPTANAIVTFQAKLPTEDKLQCGMNALTNQGVVQAPGLPASTDTAVVNLNKQCVPVMPQFVCRDITTQPNSGTPPLSVTFTANAQLSGDVQVLGYLWDFGEGQSQVFTTGNKVQHTYANEGTFMASVLIKTTQGFTKPSDACKVSIIVSKTPPPPTPPQPPVTPPQQTPQQITQPTTLINTGPGETAAAGLVGSGGIGIAISSFLKSRRALLKALLHK